MLTVRKTFILITMRFRTNDECVKQLHFVYVPTAEKYVISPDHGQREQVIELFWGEVLDIPQDKFPSWLPVFITFPITPISLNLCGEGSVLLKKIVHV